MKASIVFLAPVLAVALFAAIQPCSAQTTTQEPATPIAATAPTPVPALIPYSGATVGANGKPFTGEVTATFLIYKDEQGGEPLFTETQTVALDARGPEWRRADARGIEPRPAGQRREPPVCPARKASSETDPSCQTVIA